MNSNTLNLVGGLAIPAAFLGTGALRQAAGFSYLWLLGLTLLVLALSVRRSRLGHPGAVVVIAGYLGFVAVLLLVQLAGR